MSESNLNDANSSTEDSKSKLTFDIVSMHLFKLIDWNDPEVDNQEYF